MRGQGSQSPPRGETGAAPLGEPGSHPQDPLLDGRLGAIAAAARRTAPLLRVAGPLLLVLLGAVCLRWSWDYGPDSLIDFGRELYIPWRLGSGDTLYLDLVYLNGPLSPYWNALLFRVFGVGLRTLMIGNVLVSGCIAVLLYRLLTTIADRLAATVACAAFVSTLAFTQLGSTANYNFLTPYSHEITHGMLLALLALFALSKRGRFGLAAVAGAGFCLGLVSLTKPEIFAAAAAALGVGLALGCWAERSDKGSVARTFGVFAAAASVPPVVAFGLLVLAMPAETAFHGLIDPWTSIFNSRVSQLEFYRWVQGTDRLETNLARMRMWIVRYALLCMPLAALALAVRKKTRWRWLVAAAVGGLLLLGTGPGPYVTILGFGASSPHPPAMRINEWPHAVRALPLALTRIGQGTLAALLSDRRAGRDTSPAVVRVAFVVFALALLGKIVFNVRLHHYGFALALPGTVALLAALVSWIPRTIDRYGGFGAIFTAGSLGFLLAAAPDVVNIIEQQFATRPYTIGKQGDRFKAGRKASYVATTMREIVRRVQPDETLAVVPEGVMINYMTRRAASTPHNNFMPPELIIYGEERILADFRASPPDYIAVVHKDTTEYGFPLFGQDYAQRFYAWIEANYTRVHRTGKAPLVKTKQFGIDLLKRNAPDQSSSTGG